MICLLSSCKNNWEDELAKQVGISQQWRSLQHQTEPKSMTMNSDSTSIGGNQQQQELQSSAISPQNNKQCQPNLLDSLVFETMGIVKCISTASWVEPSHQIKAVLMPE